MSINLSNFFVLCRKIITEDNVLKLKIKELREEYRLTQKELADKISNVQRNVSNWENGTSEPDCETIVKLADLFDVSLDELFGRDKYNKEDVSLGSEATQPLLRTFRMLTAEQRAAILDLIKAFKK
ncbi:MAG: helix-turn-helix domain-containing protein [Clostridia bacterium]|nr:helix-turn-helix domain-containing protein [Clostridia bacterium]